jgi:peptidoglycan lytic transglycosylase
MKRSCSASLDRRYSAGRAHRSVFVVLAGLAVAFIALPGTARAEADVSSNAVESEQAKSPSKVVVLPVDRSGRKRVGKASYYNLPGRKMADGTPMNPNSNAAASKTLPLGTKAKVINLKNGKSAIVEIRDRGPYVPGRIVDLTPATAKQLDMKKDGVAQVAVIPIEVPMPDGRVIAGVEMREPDGSSLHPESAFKEAQR